MIIPVRVDPGVQAYITSHGRILNPDHPLYYEKCPVCNGWLGLSPVALVYVGREPNDTSRFAAVAVAVHDHCTDVPETRG